MWLIAVPGLPLSLLTWVAACQAPAPGIPEPLNAAASCERVDSFARNNVTGMLALPSPVEEGAAGFTPAGGPRRPLTGVTQPNDCKTECDDKYQDCIDSGPKSCLKQRGGKTLCQRCWERCNAGDSPSAECRQCRF